MKTNPEVPDTGAGGRNCFVVRRAFVEAHRLALDVWEPSIRAFISYFFQSWCPGNCNSGISLQGLDECNQRAVIVAVLTETRLSWRFRWNSFWLFWVIQECILSCSWSRCSTSICSLHSYAQVKVVFIGPTGGGKTSLCMRWCMNQFAQGRSPTVGGSTFTNVLLTCIAAFFTGVVNIGHNHVKLEVWDTAGAPRYYSLRPMYVRNAGVCTSALVITTNHVCR